MELSDKEKQVVWHALSVAADRFDEDAKTCAEQPRLQEHFIRQASDTRALLEKFE